jgi:hypothetical protein
MGLRALKLRFRHPLPPFLQKLSVTLEISS